MGRLHLIACLLGFNAAVAWAGPACPERPVQIAFSDRSASYFLRGQGKEFLEPDPGRIVLEVRAVVQGLGCPASLVRLPHRRLVQALDNGEIDLAVGYHDLPERVQRWRFPLTHDGRVASDRAIASSPVAWVVLKSRKTELEAAWRTGVLPGRLGAARETVAEAMALAAGLKTEQVLNLSEVAKLLSQGRFDAIAMPVLAYAEEVMTSDVPLALLTPPLGQLRYFAPASRRFHDEAPGYVQAFWAGLCDEAQRRPQLPGCQR